MAKFKKDMLVKVVSNSDDNPAGYHAYKIGELVTVNAVHEAGLYPDDKRTAYTMKEFSQFVLEKDLDFAI